MHTSNSELNSPPAALSELSGFLFTPIGKRELMQTGVSAGMPASDGMATALQQPAADASVEATPNQLSCM